MLLGIDHIEIIVRDVEESVAFYEKLGFEILLRSSHHGGSAELKLPGDNQPVIEIHKVTGEENVGINHIAFKVDSAQNTLQEITKQGVNPERGPHFVEATGRTNVNLRDPDGWRLQLVDADRKPAQHASAA